MTREAKAGKKARKRPVEIELKFRVDDLAAGAAVMDTERFGALAAEADPAREVLMEDRYLDTTDGVLTHAGYAVRLRALETGTLVSVKSLTRVEAAGGASKREEIEGPADAVAPPADWPASDARALVMEHAGDAPLQELVTIRQRRRKRLYRSDAATVELSLDDIEVVADGEVVERFTELEAELVSGDEAALAVIAAVLELSLIHI